ncbi:Holliday junction resolvase RuvX [Candidatus Palibaumannia cicadellinicola]|uniref:Putative pre-16S rRNA nuclease n=1 Tax=Candidatus Palibaumannia cicadellinicola TaxID=186490 RepID=A0A088MYG8_9GAMM|nr:Holliday junction resolvase RuvX [Candidatus Baumannia cicadellinicola]AIN47400.1 Putative Holliday junction resolvase YggF [Candidatus Baumannia cicadellinicola]
MINSIFMAFDFGTKNIGIAIGQRITCTAQPLTTFKVRNGIPNWLQLKQIIQDWQPKTIIVGLPLNMDASDQPITIKARHFANLLRYHCDVQVVLHDERLSTIEARANLFAYGGYRALKKKQVDARAAVIIMESWFEQFPIES